MVSSSSYPRHCLGSRIQFEMASCQEYAIHDDAQDEDVRDVGTIECRRYNPEVRIEMNGMYFSPEE